MFSVMIKNIFNSGKSRPTETGMTNSRSLVIRYANLSCRFSDNEASSRKRLFILGLSVFGALISQNQTIGKFLETCKELDFTSTLMVALEDSLFCRIT